MSEKRLLVATIGSEYDEGVWGSLEAAGRYCVEQGISVTIDPIGNKCVTPYHGLAMMRNLGFLRAIDAQATHVLLVDTDILWHDKAALHRMMTRDVPGLVPFYIKDFPNKLQEPDNLDVDESGLATLEWAIMSCVLFDCEIFTKRAVSPIFFQDFMAISEEVYYWTYLRLFGVDCLQDTESAVTMLRPPTPMVNISGHARIETRLDNKEMQVKYVRV